MPYPLALQLLKLVTDTYVDMAARFARKTIPVLGGCVYPWYLGMWCLWFETNPLEREGESIMFYQTLKTKLEKDGIKILGVADHGGFVIPQTNGCVICNMAYAETEDFMCPMCCTHHGNESCWHEYRLAILRIIDELRQNELNKEMKG